MKEKVLSIGEKSKFKQKKGKLEKSKIKCKKVEKMKKKVISLEKINLSFGEKKKLKVKWRTKIRSIGEKRKIKWGKMIVFQWKVIPMKSCLRSQPVLSFFMLDMQSTTCNHTVNFLCNFFIEKKIFFIFERFFQIRQHKWRIKVRTYGDTRVVEAHWQR